ncbi:MAG: hypothetical protein RLZZ555_526 [Pseudomonadota bacterium]|jgi:uncharacterized protein YcbX
MNQLFSSDEMLPLQIEQLWIYPVKSCAGIRLQQAELEPAGLAWDRTWMVVDADGVFVSQRDLPRMALIQPQLQASQLELNAPGMLPLHLGLEVDPEWQRVPVEVWDDPLLAWDMGDAAAQWFSGFLQSDLRLVRFDPAWRRLSSAQWTQGVEAVNRFSDGYPLLVVSGASLADLNERLQAAGHDPVGIERFRANLVLGGIESHDEDRLAELVFPQAGGGRIRLQPVKPCARCPIPDIDPATARLGSSVRAALQAYRQDKRLQGAITFGMNAIVREGEGGLLSEGQAGQGRWDAWET